jgi:hypothetical protein
VIEMLRNVDFRFIILQGTRNGIWLAALFVWLLPNEVEVLVGDRRLHLELAQGIQRENDQVRLSIHLGGTTNPPLGGNNNSSSWTITPWERSVDSVPVTISLKDNNSIMEWLEKEHPSPLQCARDQISNEVSAEAINAIGHLAAALVVVAASSGYLHNKSGTIAQPLKELCSFRFLEICDKILGRFGWEGLINPDRQRNIENAISNVIDNSNSWAGSNDLDILGSIITSASRFYYDKFGKPMLIPRGAKGGSGEEIVIEYAIHLAAEALLFAFCAEMPRHPLYRPLEPFKSQENAQLLRQLLQPPQALKGHGPKEGHRGYYFWDFRKRAIEVLVPEAVIIQSGDLAVASNGYVAYSAALARWDGQLTDRRAIASLFLVPGPLKAVGVEGKLVRLAEDGENITLASRLLDPSQNNIQLYEDKRCCLDERAAKNRLSTEIVHAWRIDTTMRTMYMATYLHVGRDMAMSLIQLPKAGVTKIPTSWERSIEALAFAEHVMKGNSSSSMLRLLADEWENRGWLGEKLQWCSVGKAIGPRSRYVTATSEDEKLRFFEAGNLARDHRLFIRHRTVPLLECIKVAMESCQDKSWVIIA